MIGLYTYHKTAIYIKCKRSSLANTGIYQLKKSSLIPISIKPKLQSNYVRERRYISCASKEDNRRKSQGRPNAKT